MKRIIDYCDICKDNFEREKCKMCNASLCIKCIVDFCIKIGNFEMRYSCLCKNCLNKLEFNKTKKGREFLNKIQKEIIKEITNKIERFKEKK